MSSDEFPTPEQASVQVFTALSHRGPTAEKEILLAYIAKLAFTAGMRPMLRRGSPNVLEIYAQDGSVHRIEVSPEAIDWFRWVPVLEGGLVEPQPNDAIYAKMLAHRPDNALLVTAAIAEKAHEYRHIVGEIEDAKEAGNRDLVDALRNRASEARDQLFQLMDATAEGFAALQMSRPKVEIG